jgi:hypothetical protein
MKVKAILLGIILIVFLFCLVNSSQALSDPFWENRNAGEHPWQESDFPPPDDDIVTPENSSAIWIIDVPTKIILIRVTQTKCDVRGATKAASRMNVECSTK